MGIWEKPKEWLLEALDKEFGIPSPRGHGFDAVEAMEAFERNDVDVFVGMGGNFALACSDTVTLEAGMQRIGLTVHVSTKPNRSHVVHGRTSLILPTLGRTDKDDKHANGAQFLSVEDSMSVVHSTQGRLQPVSEHLLAEPVIIARLARPPSARTIRWTGRPWPRTTTSSGTTSRGSSPDSRTSTPASGPRTASCCRTRPGTPGRSPPPPARPHSPSARWNT